MNGPVRLHPRHLPPRHLVSIGALVATLACGVGLPAYYFFSEYQRLSENLEFKAKLGASRAAKYIYEHQKFWRFHGLRLAEIIELPQTGDRPLHQRLLNDRNVVVAEAGSPVSNPALGRSAVVRVDGVAVGRLEARTSLVPLLWSAAFTMIASISISLAALLAFRVSPLRALDRSMGELQANSRWLDAALENMSQGFCIFGSDGGLVVCNPRYRELYCLSPAQAAPGVTLRGLLLQRLAQGTAPKGLDVDSYVADVADFLRCGSGWHRVTELEDGRYVSVWNIPIPGGGSVSTHDDITELTRRQREAHAQNVRFDTALNNMAHGLCMFDGEQRLVVCNQKYAQIYNIPPELTRPGTGLQEILRASQASGLVAAEVALSLTEAGRKNERAIHVYELSDGRSILVKHQPMPQGSWVATHEDITERRQTEARIAHLAHHDALTDLPNRVSLYKRLKEACERTQHGDPVAVLCLDLDWFKEVNDTLGHATGDALLKAVAERLHACIHEHDSLARIGGDEFAIVQTNAPQPESATALAARFIDMLLEPFDVNGHHILVGTSVGISVAPNDGTEAGELLKNADLALHQVKGKSRGSYRFFEPSMDALMHARRQLETDLREAVATSQFELYFQPIVDLDHGRVSECEALVRWRHPTRGIVCPGDFIPLAEEIGLIAAIGEWVLHAACTEAATWPDDIGVSVNLSAAQFNQGDLAGMVAQALPASGLGSNRLVLEITESILLENTNEVLAILAGLRKLGVRIAMDDFGTGYSSLSSLSRFQFSKIKIDKSFVDGLGKNEHSAAIIEAVATLGARLDMITTAEGVETPDQLAWLRAIGISEVQGYLIGRPQPACDVTKMIAAAVSTIRSAA